MQRRVIQRVALGIPVTRACRYRWTCRYLRCGDAGLAPQRELRNVWHVDAERPGDVVCLDCFYMVDRGAAGGRRPTRPSGRRR